MKILFPFALKRYLWLCVLLSCLCIEVQAQNAASKKFKEDSAEITRLYDIAENIFNPDSALLLLNVALKKAIAINYNFRCNNVLLKIGEKYMDKGDYAQALESMKQALPYCATLPLLEKSNDYQHLGWVYFELGDYVSASESFYTSLDDFRKSGGKGPNEVFICNNLGEVYFRLHQNEKALYYYNQGADYAIKNNWQNSLALIMLSKGEYFLSQNMPDSAKILYEKVNEIGERTGRPDVSLMANEGMGISYIESGNYNKAIVYLQTALTFSEKRYKFDWITSSFYLGEAWYRMGKYEQAENILLPALKEAVSGKLKDNTIKGYTTLLAVYKATGQFAKALECMDSISVLKDSLENAEKVKAVNLMDIKFLTAEKDKQIALQNNKIAHKNMLMLATGGSVILLLLVSAGVYFQSLNKQRSIEKENKIGILKAAVQGGDNERSRIARELHDGIGGMLSAAMMRFSSIHHDDPAITTAPAYREAMNILREMGDEIRKTAHNLMPEVLLKQSLPEAVRAYCNNVQEAGTLNIDFQCYGSFDGLIQDYKLNLYRIMQELVKNVIIHAKADHALVQLLQNENKLIVSVEDNGTGFNIQDIKGGLGLSNIRTRAGSLDGHFTLESEPGKGTTVIVEFEIPALGTLTHPDEKTGINSGEPSI